MLKEELKSGAEKRKEALINGDFELLHELAKCKNESSSYCEIIDELVSPSTSLRVTGYS